MITKSRYPQVIKSVAVWSSKRQAWFTPLFDTKEVLEFARKHRWLCVAFVYDSGTVKDPYKGT